MNRWNSFEELKEYASSYGVTLREGDIKVLSAELKVEGKTLPNRLLIQPVEGTDADAEGYPTDLVRRRYLRYARGGAGTIWMEAVALNSSLRSNERQMILNSKTLGSITELIEEIKDTGIRANGYEPVVIIQMSHPGRACLTPKPAHDNALWEQLRSSKQQLAAKDDEIERLAELYGDTAALAETAGFDGVEVKACHRFFISELLAARDRPGRYGGSYENRVRHLKESIAAVRAATHRVFVTVRLNHYDGIPFPYGFGMSSDGSIMPDGAEPLRLIGEIYKEFGVELINCSSSSPDFGLFGSVPATDPLFSEPMNEIKTGGCMHRFAKEIKDNVPGVKVVATMFSHLMQFAASVGAGMVERNEADLIGFGREGLAYPEFAVDILNKGGMDPRKVCIYCGGCNRMMGSAKGAGCIVFDEMYRN